MKRVMLATAVKDVDTVKFPVYLSPKVDGIRAVNIDGRLYSRSMKLIPNAFTQEAFGKPELHGLDGELIVGNPYDHNLMQQTSSGVMSFDGSPDVSWGVFDYWDSSDGFEARMRKAERLLQWLHKKARHINVIMLPQTLIHSVDELRRWQEFYLAKGYEGVMLRSVDGPYKENRSTLREGYMLKLKEFEDSEAEVTAVQELMHNENAAETDERGYTKRSSAKDGKTGAGVLGAIRVRDIHTGIEFDIGTGFTAEQRKNLWDSKKYLPGMLVKYKSFKIGVKEKPRFPVFLGFRDKRDM